MLTPPKWQSAWLKSLYNSKNISKKTMFFKYADSLLDELIKNSNATSKKLTLEALDCLRIWIEDQQEEDWKENEVCYAAVTPLLTKKFLPFHRDVIVCETKLSLLWLALQKTQGLMHLEGPQYILEVFIQSCLSWLSCLSSSDDVGLNMENLILNLLRSLFSNEVVIHQKNEKFPPLNCNIWKSNKLFCRLVSSFLEIFQYWTKIKEKTDLLHIWKHFLDNCELSFKLIPVDVWHKIFKLIDSICSNQEELMKNKMCFLHKCATSLKSVLSRSKFIDCSKVLTTPAEALWKIVMDLSVNNKDENIPFDYFQYCFDISQSLSSCTIDISNYEFRIRMLTELEDIESKPFLWGLWCGVACAFRQQVNYVNRENYSEMQLKMYKKLRSVAVNFDLDRMKLEDRCINMLQDQFNFLRIPMICKHCAAMEKTIAEDNASMDISTSNSESLPPNNAVKDEFSGGFGLDMDAITKSCNCLRKNQETDSVMKVDGLDNVAAKKENPVCGNCRVERWRRVSNIDNRWVVHRYSLNKPILYSFALTCGNIQKERLITLERGCRRRLLFAPICLTLLLEELCNIARKGGDPSAENFVEKVKKVQCKVKEGEVAPPIKLFLSFKGSKGVEFYSNAVSFWNDLDEIINDIDLMKNLNILKTKNNNSVVRLSMFFFLVNFAKNLYFEERDNSFFELRKLDVDEEQVVTARLVSFMRKVTDYKNRLTNFGFLDNMNKVLPTKSDNPLIVWTNFVSARHGKINESENSVSEDASEQESCCKATNDNLINIFKCFDEFENKISREDDLPTPKSTKKRAKGRVRDRKEGGRSSLRLHNRSLVSQIAKEVKIMETESVTVVQAPPDVFRTISFSEWRTETVVASPEIPVKEKETRKKRRNSKTVNVACEMPRKRTHLSTENKTPTPDIVEEVVQDENVNIENTKSGEEARNVCKKTSISLPLSPKGVYSLRKRPLQRPSKFNDMKCLFADDFTKGKSLNKNCEADNTECTQSACDCVTHEGFDREVSHKTRDIKVLKSSESDMIPVNSDFLLNSSCEKLASTVEDESKECVDIKTEKFEALEDVKNDFIVRKIEETDVNSKNYEGEISELINHLIEEVEKAENPKVKSGGVEIESAHVVEDGVVPISDSSPTGVKSNRGVKRHWKTVGEATGGKKLKTESDEASHKETELGEVLAAVPPKQKPEMPVIQSRGSKMLALIPESPKLNGYHDTSSSKHQTMKPPNVMKNSRASKMLALLPELQESVGESISVKETITEKTSPDDDNTKRGISWGSIGIIHHLTPSRKGSVISSESPKGSPLRQRRSIRFDDDRNETVTYYTDSPPCQTIKQGMRFRGSDK